MNSISFTTMQMVMSFFGGFTHTNEAKDKLDIMKNRLKKVGKAIINGYIEAARLMYSAERSRYVYF